VVEEKFEYIK
jgi:mitogen-activated protein kinase 1/3